jgi:hypothetical protein
MDLTGQVGWIGKVSDLHSGGARLESRPGHAITPRPLYPQGKEPPLCIEAVDEKRTGC